MLLVLVVMLEEKILSKTLLDMIYLKKEKNKMNKLHDFEVMEISLVKEGAVMEDFLTLKAKNKEEKMPETLVEKILEEKKIEAEKPVEEAKVEVKEEIKEEVKVEEVVKSLEAENKELIQKVKAFEDEKKQAIYKSKAEAFVNLNNKDLPEILKAIDENLSKEVSEKLLTILTKANKMAENSEMFKELGASEAEVNSIEQVEAIAKARATKEKISYERAYVEEINKRKELYRRTK